MAGGVQLLAVTQIEQTMKPVAATWYPKFGREEFLLTATSEFKFKLFNATTHLCRKTVLGPVYGSPITNMQVVNKGHGDHAYLAFTTASKVAGLVKLPIEGNPYRSIGAIAHPGEVSHLAVSHDGTHMFTAGGRDGVVKMWRLNTDVLEAQSQLGGDGVEPYLNMLEGGKDGLIYNELQDYFYYGQIRQWVSK